MALQKFNFNTIVVIIIYPR